MTKAEKQELIDYLDALVKEGKEVKLCWEGGGDSGWVWFEIDGDKVSERGNDKKIEALVDYMYDHLDYGSWAGEFSANGEASYNTEDKSFTGTDFYSEDHTLQHPSDIQIRIPKSLWFDRLEIQIQGEEPDVDAVFHIKNGFLTNEHHDYISNFIKHLGKEIEEVINDFNKTQDLEYRSIWEHYELNHSEFKEEEDYMVYNIESVGIGTYDTDEKSIYLNLEELSTDEEE